VNYVFGELKKVYSNVMLNKPIPLPLPAFYAVRNRYRADSLIQFLDRRTANGHVSIGLTNKDISPQKMISLTGV
jgi:archaemetzincin